MNKTATLGSMIADTIGGVGDIEAGKEGFPSPVPAEGPGTYSQLADRQLGESMKPFYELADRAREAEAQRIAQSIFGNRMMGSPARSILSRILANKTYNTRIRPFLDSVQRDLAGGRAAVADEPLSPESSAWARAQKERLMRSSARLRQKEIDNYLARFRSYLARSGWNVDDEGNVTGMAGETASPETMLEM